MTPRRHLAALIAGLLLGSAGIEAAQPAQLPGDPTMPTPSTLKVPGATVYYEKRGTGPLLLIIPGGPQDAGVFAELATALADRYTVVAYDPRGNSRSTFDAAPTPLNLDVQADDAAALIRELGGGPAHVFGTSGGAQIGLNLAVRYPDLVATMIAHEPPTMMLLDDPAPEVEGARALHRIYREQGVEAAMAAFFGANSLDGPTGGELPPDDDAPSEAAETMGRVMGNFDYWLAHGLLPLSFFEPDVRALGAGAPRIVVGISEESRGQPIARMSGALADRLGLVPVAFPGDHIDGFDMPEFAEAVHGAIAP